MQLQTPQVDTGDAVELLQRAIAGRSDFGHDASVVEGRVQSAELGDRPLGHGLYLNVVADVASDGKGSMALADQPLRGFPNRFLFDVGKRHGCTRLRKRLGGRQPHAGTGPGDKRNLVVEVRVVVHIRSGVRCSLRVTGSVCGLFKTLSQLYQFLERLGEKEPGREVVYLVHVHGC